MLPKLHILRTVAVVGHLRHTVPASINCPQCGRETGHYQELEFVLDSWVSECDLVAASGGAYFVSEKLLAELEEISASGYVHRPAMSIRISDDFRRSHPKITATPNELHGFRYFAITGQCDGPWLQNTRGGDCATCGQPRAIPPEHIDFDALVSEIMGDVPAQPRLVFPETWHGEDFFYLSEPGPPLITERVAAILAKRENLRKEKVKDRDTVRRLMPKYAESLEAKDWKIERCIGLGPADWVTES